MHIMTCQPIRLHSSSKCKGFTRISEDSSEIAFLLVENYTMTAHSGLRIGMEFLKNMILQTFHLMPSLMEGCEEDTLLTRLRPHYFR